MATHHRKALDKLQNRYAHLYTGVVLDIGGRDRGRFVKPRDRVDKWIFADSELVHHPDIQLDVCDMHEIVDGSIDVVNAIELFEHVAKPEQGLGECWRVLKPGGYFIAAMPFLYPVHGDPYDYQRWTERKWQEVLEDIGFEIETIEIVGGYFSVLADMLGNLSVILRIVFGGLIWLDETKMVKQSSRLNRFHSGYFVIATKS